MVLRSLLARLLFLSLLFAPLPLAAKSAAPRAPVPWLYKGSDITPDPAWRFGTLANGIRYAVRRNGVPPGQVSVRVRIDAGSLMERDEEQGYAHLIEHLSFMSSAKVPMGDAKRIWQRLGATFGSDTNAQTSPTQTVFKLDLPSATSAGLDESLGILRSMVASPGITDAAIASERPAVLAEQREGAGPQQRYADAVRQLFYAGQLLADRSPIGTLKTLEAATPAKVKAFHDRWYRPERVVVIVAGDADPAEVAKLIERNFADWKVSGSAPAEPNFGRPDPARPAAATVVDPQLPPLVAMAVLRPWTYRDDTVVFNQNRFVDLLAIRIINRRLEQRARSGGSYIAAQTDLEDMARSANGTFVNIMPAGDDWETALRDVRAVIADAVATAPGTAEIARELAEFDAALKTDVETAATEASARQADTLVQALDIRETVAAPGIGYDIFKGAVAKRLFTPARLLASTRRIFTGTRRAIVTTREAGENVPARLAVALKADVSGLAVRRSSKPAVTFADLPKLGPPGTVASTEPAYEIGVQRVRFANGVRLMLFPNPGEVGKVYVRVRFGGGYNALPADRESPAYAAELALVPSGIGSLGQEEIDQLTAGRRIGMDFAIEEDAFSLSAVTSPADLADQLTLIAAKLAHPGWDPNPVARARAVMLAGYATMESSPDGVLSRDLEALLHADDPRWGTPPREEVERLDAARFRALWEPLLASGPVEVQVFGDVTAEAGIAAVAKSLGAIPPRTPSTTPPPPVRFPAHVAQPVVRTHDGADNQAAAVIAWPAGAGVVSIAEGRRLEVLASIFQDRLFDRLRTGAGASYSPSVSSDWPLALPGGGRLLAIGQVPPEKVPLFFQLARTIAAELAAQPVDADEIRRTLVPLQQSIERASTGNGFWMRQLGGGAFDDRRMAAMRSLVNDYLSITPEILQQTARKYLRPEMDWTMAVLPKAVAQAAAPAGAAPGAR